ncbi:Membrane sensor protein UhpC [Candidatus Entotheonellaceae bacterium PAL068K]
MAGLSGHLVAVAYALAFLQRVAPPAIMDRLMADFRVGASQIGLMTSAYFYGYMVMQLPAGLLVDHWGVRQVILISSVASAIGTFWFAGASSLMGAAAARAVVALGDALVFSALIKIATQWFSANRFGLMFGLSQIAGYIGGLLAITPLAVLVSLHGWRASFSLLTGLVSAHLVLCLIWLRNHPAHDTAAMPTRREIVTEGRRLLRRSITWGPIVTYLGNYVPSLSLSGVWGFPLLMQAYGLSRDQASVPMFVFMLGYAIGALLFGYLVDAHFRTLRKPIWVVTAGRMVLLVVLAPVIGVHLPGAMMVTCLTALGLLTGGMIPLTLTSLRLGVSQAQIGLGIGLMGTLANLAAGMVQPLLGLILDAHWSGEMREAVRLYPPNAYSWLLVVLAGLCLCSAAGPLFSVGKET